MNYTENENENENENERIAYWDEFELLEMYVQDEFPLLYKKLMSENVEVFNSGRLAEIIGYDHISFNRGLHFDWGSGVKQIKGIMKHLEDNKHMETIWIL